MEPTNVVAEGSLHPVKTERATTVMVLKLYSCTDQLRCWALTSWLSEAEMLIGDETLRDSQRWNVSYLRCRIHVILNNMNPIAAENELVMINEVNKQEKPLNSYDSNCHSASVTNDSLQYPTTTRVPW